MGRSRQKALWALLLLIVAIEAAAFLVSAGRGLDLTDEGYYLLKYRYWTDWPTVSLFGAYFSVPFSLFGHDVWVMRALGFALLLGGGMWFGREATLAFDALAGRKGRAGVGAASIACGAGLWSYYGAFAVPYTPSYNLLTLVCALAALALALRIGRAILLGRHGLSSETFLLGLLTSVGIASKFSSGVLFLALCLVVVGALGWRRIDAATGTRLALALLAGLALNIALLWVADPDLPGRFQRGIEESLAVMPRNPARELGALATVEVPKAVLASLRILLFPVVAAVLASAAGTLLGRRPLGDSLAVAFLVAGALLDTFVKDNRAHRIILLTLLALLLAAAAPRVLRASVGTLALPRAMLVAGAILVAPFAYSFGTNNPLLWHMAGAAIFPTMLVVAQVRAMWVADAIATWVFAASLVLLAALPAEFLVRQWIDGNYTYRLGAPLATQTTQLPRNPGGIALRVTPGLARGVDDYLRVVRDSGFVAGQPMIDFTGQAPGLVALSGGVPLGSTWLIGGPMFDGNQTARISLRSVDPTALRRAWLLTSADSFASIDAWAEIMKSRVGAFAHEEAGHVTVPDPTSNDKAKTMEVTVWRPKR